MVQNDTKSTSFATHAQNAAKQTVMRENDVAYRMLHPLIKRSSDVPEAHHAIALFSQNMRTGRKLFGEYWYLNPGPGARLLFRSLTDLDPEKPLGQAAELCGCVDMLREAIEAVRSDEQSLLGVRIDLTV